MKCPSWSPFDYFRSYKVSPNTLDYDEAYAYCQGFGLGLAIWKDVESYEDIKHLSSVISTSGNGVYTALNNADDHTCTDGASCDGYLMFRQTADGPREFFQRDPTYQPR